MIELSTIIIKDNNIKISNFLFCIRLNNDLLNDLYLIKIIKINNLFSSIIIKLKNVNIWKLPDNNNK